MSLMGAGEFRSLGVFLSVFQGMTFLYIELDWTDCSIWLGLWCGVVWCGVTVCGVLASMRVSG